MTGGKVGQYGGNGERRNSSGTGAEHVLLFLLDGGKAADSRSDDDAGPFIRGGAPGAEGGVLHGHVGGGQGIDDKIVIPSQFLFIYMRQRIETLQFPGDLRIEGGTIESGDGAHAGTSLAHTFPSFPD